MEKRNISSIFSFLASCQIAFFCFLSLTFHLIKMLHMLNLIVSPIFTCPSWWTQLGLKENHFQFHCHVWFLQWPGLKKIDHKLSRRELIMTMNLSHWLRSNNRVGSLELTKILVHPYPISVTYNAWLGPSSTSAGVNELECQTLAPQSCEWHVPILVRVRVHIWTYAMDLHTCYQQTAL